MYSVVFTWPDQTKTTEAVGIHSLDVARRTASTFIAPVGHLRPEWVEIRAGSSVTRGGSIEWTDNGGITDDGHISDGGRIIWRADGARRGDQTVAETEATPTSIKDPAPAILPTAIDPADGEQLDLLGGAA